MKKIFNLVFILIFMFIIDVKAENVEYNGNIPGFSDDYFIQSSKILNKYLITNHNSALLYSNFKDLEKEIGCDDGFIINDGIICRDEIYDYENSSSISYFTLYDSNFNQVITEEDNSKTNLYSDENTIIKYNDYYVFINNDSLYIPLIIDKDMKTVSDDIYNEITKHYYDIFIKIDGELIKNYDSYWLMQTTNNNYLFITSDLSDYSAYLLMYDDLGNLVFKIDIPSYNTNFSATIANNGVYLFYIDETDGSWYLEKYNLNGNKIYTQILSDLLNLESRYYSVRSIYADGNEINIIIYRLRSQSLPTELPDAFSYMVSFAINYDIKTNVNGYGVVEVDEKGIYNEQKVMQITPEPSNKIASLTITDSAGNSIPYTDDYKFVMPNSDVTIDATFELKTATPSGDNIETENPNTGATIPTFLLISGFMASFVIYRYVKKKSFLKL